MQKADMREVHDVVGFQQPVDLDVQIIAEVLETARRRHMARQIRYQSLVRLVRIAGPYPQDAVALRQRETPHREFGREMAAPARVGDAGSAAGEVQPMIAAFDAIGKALAHAQRGEAMRAPVMQRHRHALVGSKQDYRHIEQPSRQQLLRNLASPGRHIPGVQREGAVMTH